jgi:hypothetical protein
MNFSHNNYIAQGLYPPCPRARYIPSSSPIGAGAIWLPDDSRGEMFIAWEQRCMATGGVLTVRLWWVPMSDLPEDEAEDDDDDRDHPSLTAAERNPSMK